MSLKFSIHRSSQYCGKNVSAHKAGFRAVEIPYPRSEEELVVKVKQETGLQVALLNIALGENVLQLGATSIPGPEKHFKTHLDETVKLAKQLNCSKIHLMSGLVAESPIDEHLKTYLSNFIYAAPILGQENIVGVIEPINKYLVPSYVMNSYVMAVYILENVKSRNLKLLFDVILHQQGYLQTGFTELANHIGHIQIAQVPHRHQPEEAGELYYGYIFSLIEKMGYSDWIGCEYKPKITTTMGLKWSTKYNQQL